MLNLDIKKVAILGAGIMGAGIATIIAETGIPVILLDIIPRELTNDEIEKGLKLEDKAVRNRFGIKAKNLMKDPNNKALFIENAEELIEVGNFEDDLNMLSEADWVIEVVLEKIEVKKALIEKIVKHLKPGVIMSTNTSGVSVNKIIEDQPNFIANRIINFAFMSILKAKIEFDFNYAEIDKMTGIMLGRSTSATFRTLDLIGLDVVNYISGNLSKSIEDKEEKDILVYAETLRPLIEANQLGNKTGKGFYKKEKDELGTKILVWNEAKNEYEGQNIRILPTVIKAELMHDVKDRLKTLLSTDDEDSKFMWQITKELLLFSAKRIPEIADDFVEVDNAVKWGFNWEIGPFEIWDVLGLKETTERMKSENAEIPEWVVEWISSGKTHFYM